MGVGFVTGRLCTDRLDKIFDICFEEAKIESRDPIFILVPEKNSYEVEKRFSERLKIDKDPFFRIRVVTFSSLSNIVFSNTGGLVETKLSRSARNMLIYKAIESVSSDLKTIRVGSGVGIVNKCLDLIIEFKQNNMTVEDVKDMVELTDDEELNHRLSDYHLIYSQYEKLIEDKYFDVEDNLELFAKSLENFSGIKNATILISEFTGFTPIQYNILERLIVNSKNTYISLITDLVGFNSRKGVFSKTNITFLKINEICQRYGIKRIKDYTLYEKNYYDNDYLRFLERNINKYKVDKYNPENTLKDELDKNIQSSDEGLVKEASLEGKNVQSSDENLVTLNGADIDEHLKVMQFSNIYEEARYVADEIMKLIKVDGYRYRDITVASRNIDEYEHILNVIFADYDIRYFIDKKFSAKFNPVVIFVLSILRMKSSNYSYDSVFKYLKTGFSNMDLDEVSKLENFVLENGVKGKKWFEEKWELPIFHSIDDEENVDLTDINEIKDKMFSPIKRLHDKLKGRNKVGDICRYLYEFLIDIGLDTRIASMIDEFDRREEVYKSLEYTQVWKSIVSTLEEMYEFVGDEYISLEKFIGLMEAEFEGIEIGIVPPGRDEVKITSVDRMSSSGIKVLFLLGCRDGAFPASVVTNSMIGDNDRGKLLKYGVKFDSDSITKYYDEQYLIYKTMSSSSSKLIVSYYKSNFDGDEMEASPIIKKIRKMFPMLKESYYGMDGNDVGVLKDIYSKEGLFNVFENGAFDLVRNKNFDKNKEFLWSILHSYFSNEDDYANRLNMIDEAINYSNKVDILGENISDKIYGKGIFSVSKLEKYASCPFSYFINYGLRLRPKKKLEFTPLDSGIYNHKIIDEFSKSVLHSGVSWMDLDRAYIEKEIRKISSRLIMSKKSYILNSSKKYFHMTNRINNNLIDSIELMVEQIKRGNFNPSGFEVEFDINSDVGPIRYKLNNDREVILVGKIDRVDICNNDDVDYIRLIDYKSSNRDLDINKIYEGLQMQLFIYMRAILESKHRIGHTSRYENNPSEEAFNYRPAALLYSRFNLSSMALDGYRDLNEKDDIDLREGVLKENKLKGYVIKDVDVVKNLDKTLDENNKSSRIMSIEVKKNGEIGQRTKGLELEEFDIINNYVLNKAKKVCEDIYSGNIEILPYKYEGEVACNFCDFKSICQFDMSTGKNNYKLIRKISKRNDLEDILLRMSKNKE